MDCHGVPTRLVGWMNGPALPILCCWGAVPFWRQIPSGASQGKSGKNFRKHEDLVLEEVPCCQHQGRVSQGGGTWAQTKQKCPSVSDPRRGRSDCFCIAEDNSPACQPQGYPVWSQAGQHTQTTALCTQPANGPPGTCFSLRAHLGMPEPTLWHALISWQSSSLSNRRCFPVLLTPNDTLFYKCRLPLIAPWQGERQTPPFLSKDCHLINRQVSLRI